MGVQAGVKAREAALQAALDEMMRWLDTREWLQIYGFFVDNYPCAKSCAAER